MGCVRATLARACGLLLAASGGRVFCGLAALVRALVLAAVLSTVLTVVSSSALASQTSPLLVGALGVLLCAFAVARSATVVLPVTAGYGPVIAVRDHHRELARRGFPRLRDPAAPGRTRSRAPSGLIPAAL